MYDFANSGYTTVVITAVINAYFVGVVAAGAPWATFAWILSPRSRTRDADGCCAQA
jgi:UMF1 family MFS transporter